MYRETFKNSETEWYYLCARSFRLTAPNRRYTMAYSESRTDATHRRRYRRDLGHRTDDRARAGRSREPTSFALRGALNRSKPRPPRSKFSAAERSPCLGCGPIKHRCENLLAACIGEFGKVDILVNSAGRTKREPTLDSMRRRLEPDPRNEPHRHAPLLPDLRPAYDRANGYGRIINIASLSTFVSLFEVAAYSASKAAVASLTKSLAVEWARHGVNVNAIAPGVFQTALNQKLLDETTAGHEFLTRTPMGRFGKVEELAGPPFFLRRKQPVS